MRRLLSLVPIVCGSLLAFSGSARAQLHCEQPTAQAGLVKCGTALTHRFLLTNSGKEPITITEMRPSCGCLAPKLDRSILRSGQEGELLLEVNTLTQASGPQSWNTTLRYQCGAETRELMLTLNAKIETEVLVTPAALNISTSTAISHEISVTDLRARPFTITGVSVASPDMRVFLGAPRKNADGKQTWVVKLDVSSGLADGRHDDQILIQTDDATYPRLVVPVKIEKRPRVRVRAVPEEMSIQRVNGSPISRVVLLRPIDGQAIEVAKLECPEPGISAEWTDGPGTMVSIKVSIQPTTRRDGETTLTVQLSKPGVQTLKIPVRWTTP